MGETVASWPERELVPAPCCPICGSKFRRLKYRALRDAVFNTAPGHWKLYSCSNCSSAWLDPRPSDQSLGMAYEGYFTHGEAIEPSIVRRRGVVRRLLHDAANAYLSERYGLERAPARRAWMVKCIPPLRAACDASCRHLPRPGAGARLLDVGCGNGGFLRLARAMGWNAEGLDFDPHAVEVARGLGFNVSCGGIELLAGEEGVFDVVTSSHVIEHVPDPKKHLREIFRLLRPGGMLWVQTPNILSLGARLYGRDWRGLEPPRHLQIFNESSLGAIVSEAGFQQVSVRPEAGNALIVIRASDAIRQGKAVEGSSRSKRNVGRDILVEGIEWLAPRLREFVTITCLKPMG